MFPELKITSRYFGGNSKNVNERGCIVTVKAMPQTGELLQAPSPSSFTGTGGCFGSAREDYIKKFDAYLEALTAFRNQVLYTSRAYTEVITVNNSDSGSCSRNENKDCYCALKTCPLCGNDASLHTVDLDDRNWIVECKNCRLQTSWCGDKNAAVEKWNTRKSEKEAPATGEWVYGEYDIPHCSECGTEVKEISPFCPQCGARMEEDEYNG